MAPFRSCRALLVFALIPLVLLDRLERASSTRIQQTGERRRELDAIVIDVDDDDHASFSPPQPPPPPQPPLVPSAIVRVDLSSAAPTPPLLWGLFIEEIQHAGDGGLYAELAQDRSFGGTALSLGVGEATGEREAELPVGGAPWSWAMKKGESARGASYRGGSSSRGDSYRRYRRRSSKRDENDGNRNDENDEDGNGPGPVPGSGLPPAWKPLSGSPSSVVTLVAGAGNDDGDGEEGELSIPAPPREANGRRLSLRVASTETGGSSLSSSSSSSAVVGVENPGFWGIPVRPGDEFDLVTWLYVPSSSGSLGRKKKKASDDDGDDGVVVVELVVGAEENAVVAASTALLPPSLDSWNKIEAKLVAPANVSLPMEMTTSPFASARLVVRTRDPPPPMPPPPLLSASPSNRRRLAFALAAVSLFPAENGPLGSVSPFRSDLLRSLKKLKPRYLRVPGGCYTEGDVLSDAFDWSTTIRQPLARPGHWNGPWRYFSTDGLGLFEWLSLGEELGAPVVWVASAGVAHRQSLPTSGGGGVAVAASVLGALDFALGESSSRSDTDDDDIFPPSSSSSSSSPWADARATIFNRPQPFPALAALAIGNEDCGKPYYETNFAAVREALALRHPGLAVVSNCGDDASLDADLADWHYYGSADDIWNHRDAFSSAAGSVNYFDSRKPRPLVGNGDGNGATPFATEFAAFDWGIPTAPAGWIRGAVAEAGFMAGLENAAASGGGGRRGSKGSGLSSSRPVVAGGSFAPALAHARGTDNCPTTLLVFDAGRSFETPSFYVQELFANSAGQALAAVSTAAAEGAGGVVASASCEREDCSADSSSPSIFVKIVSYSASSQRVRVDFVDGGGDRKAAVVLSADKASATFLAHPDPTASNSFDLPRKVRPVGVDLPLSEPAASSGVVELEMPPYSLAVLKVERGEKKKEEEEEEGVAASLQR